jgi:hypothetical protein
MATALAAPSQREHKGTLMWQQEDALEGDLPTVEQHLTASAGTLFLSDADNMYKVSIIANHHAQDIGVQNI